MKKKGWVFKWGWRHWLGWRFWSMARPFNRLSQWAFNHPVPDATTEENWELTASVYGVTEAEMDDLSDKVMDLLCGGAGEGPEHTCARLVCMSTKKGLEDVRRKDWKMCDICGTPHSDSPPEGFGYAKLATADGGLDFLRSTVMELFAELASKGGGVIEAGIGNGQGKVAAHICVVLGDAAAPIQAAIAKAREECGMSSEEDPMDKLKGAISAQLGYSTGPTLSPVVADEEIKAVADMSDEEYFNQLLGDD